MMSKRIFDVCLSGIGILVSLPLWLFIAIAIKLEDGGPVFYSQERVGKGGKVFKVIKFRSMIPDAEKHTTLGGQVLNLTILKAGKAKKVGKVGKARKA